MKAHHIRGQLSSALFGALLVIGTSSLAGDVSIPNTFAPNTPISASQMNQNFEALEIAVDDNAGKLASLGGVDPQTFQFQPVPVDCNADPAALDTALLKVIPGTGGFRFEVSGPCGETDVSGLDNIKIIGDGTASISSAATGETMELGDCQNVDFANISIVNTGTGRAVLIDQCRHVNFDNVVIQSDGGNAIEILGATGILFAASNLIAGGGAPAARVFASNIVAFGSAGTGGSIITDGGDAIEANRANPIDIDGVDILTITAGIVATEASAVALRNVNVPGDLRIGNGTVATLDNASVDGFVDAFHGSRLSSRHSTISGSVNLHLNSSASCSSGTEITGHVNIDRNSSVLLSNDTTGADPILSGGVNVSMSSVFASDVDFFGANPSAVVTCELGSFGKNVDGSDLCNRLSGVYAMHRRGTIVEDGGGGITFYGNDEPSGAADFQFNPDGTLALSAPIGREAIGDLDSPFGLFDGGLDFDGGSGTYTLLGDGRISLFGGEVTGTISPDGSVITFGGLKFDTDVTPTRIEDNIHVLIRKRFVDE